jgi:polyhydroxyalkanoate synthesis regulator phasin
MIDLIKKSLFTGIGIATHTHEKVTELGKKFIADAKLSEEDGKKFIDDLTRKTQDARDAMEKIVRDTIDKTLDKMKIPTSKEVAELQQRIAALEAELRAGNSA